MFERVLSFLRDLPTGAGAHASTDDPRIAASALLYHVMNADGVRQDVEWERFKAVLAESYSISGAELEALAAAGERADNEAIDFYAFTSVLKRHLDADARKAFIGLMWEIVYADGELHELEDNTVWRVAELIGVERRDRVEARRKAAAHAPGATGTSSDEYDFRRPMPRQTSSKPKILIVLHQENSSPGRVGHMLLEEGFELDIRRPPLGDTLPETLDGHAGTVVFGGPMSANDEDEFVRRETNWLEIPLKENRPFLGICLGAQMLANHLGGKVEGHGEGLVEIGWYPLKPTEAGKQLMHWPEMVYQFHREGFSLPRDATLLATAETYPNQAFRYGDNAWGIQFHGELTRVMMQRWVVRGAHRFELPGAQPGRDHLGGRLIWDMHLKRWLDEFLRVIFGKPSNS